MEKSTYRWDEDEQLFFCETMSYCDYFIEICISVQFNINFLEDRKIKYLNESTLDSYL